MATLGSNQPLFELGTTLTGTVTIGGTATLMNDHVLGTRHEFVDVDYSNSTTGGQTRLSGASVKAIALRNTSGITLLGKRLVLLDITAGRGRLKNADGYAHDQAVGLAVLVDPWLSSAGVVDDDIFWGIYSGPALCLTPSVAADFNLAITAGSPLVAATGTTSGNSTGGRVANVTLPGQTGATAAFSAALGLVGFAMSARTTDITNSDILVDLAVRLPY